MKQKKILFFDIDGTLFVEDTRTVPKSTVLALKKAKQNGHLIFINTGRPFSTIDQDVHDLQPDGYVCGCGTYIHYQGQSLFEKKLTKSRSKEIVSLLRKTNIDAVLEGTTRTYFDTNVKHPFVATLKDIYNKARFNLGHFDETDIMFDKFAIWYDEHADIETFKNNIPEFTYIVRGEGFGEIVPSDCSKATGIQFLADYFNTSIDNCYVFGDSSNDESMLSYVKHAIVMGNGDPALFKHAYYVTKHINDDGIHHALEYLQLI